MIKNGKIILLEDVEIDFSLPKYKKEVDENEKYAIILLVLFKKYPNSCLRTIHNWREVRVRLCQMLS